MIQLFKNHWFKIAIVAILAYAVLKKDFSFNFNMNNKQDSKESVSKGKYTENVATTSNSEELSLLDFLAGKAENVLQKKYDGISEKEKIKFVKRFGKVARNEQDKFNIPTSVILATALIQSHVGQRPIASDGNNFFALRCTKSWDKKTLQEQERCYRAYPSAWESFRDHSIFLKEHIHLKKGDYEDWINAIGKKFNTGDEYVSLIKNVIEQYKLNSLDKD
jgi:flagellum-specific peptidoglycan hydrolase FlgJ